MRLLSKVEKIIVHHAALPVERASLESIRKLHVQTRGWTDIGYHYVVESASGMPSGLWVVRPGRPANMVGAHTKADGMNHRSLGVCVAGWWDDEHDGRPPEGAVFRAAQLVADLCIAHGLTADAVLGHREVEGASTECPGAAFDMADFRRRVTRLMAGRPRPMRSLPDSGADGGDGEGEGEGEGAEGEGAQAAGGASPTVIGSGPHIPHSRTPRGTRRTGKKTKSSLLRVRVRKVDYAALAMAAISGNISEVAELLDDAFEFEGIIGPILEAVDGPLLEAAAMVLVEAVQQAVRRRGV